jgi:hypothetical protein
LTVCVIPPPETVIVAVRWLVDTFAEVVTVTVPLLAPEAGETVAQDSELVTVQPVLEETANDWLPPLATKDRLAGLMVSV